jgi:hypothetical protein
MRRHHLLQREGLGDVVVAAQRQAGDLVLAGVPRRQEQHRRPAAAAAQRADHAEAVEPRHHHVQDEQVRPVRPGGLERGGPVGGRLHLEAGEAQAGRSSSRMFGSSSTTRIRASGCGDVLVMWPACTTWAGQSVTGGASALRSRPPRPRRPGWSTFASTRSASPALRRSAWAWVSSPSATCSSRWLEAAATSASTSACPRHPSRLRDLRERTAGAQLGVQIALADAEGLRRRLQVATTAVTTVPTSAVRQLVGQRGGDPVGLRPGDRAVADQARQGVGDAAGAPARHVGGRGVAGLRLRDRRGDDEAGGQAAEPEAPVSRMLVTRSFTVTPGGLEGLSPSVAPRSRPDLRPACPVAVRCLGSSRAGRPTLAHDVALLTCRFAGP